MRAPAMFWRCTSTRRSSASARSRPSSWTRGEPGTVPISLKHRILVIDDEAAIRDSLRMILEYEQYDFVGAASGPDGIAAIKRERPDLVILDIKMPGMSGLEALAEIRKADEQVPVAMISGHGTVTDAMQATRLGAFDFIEKPFTSER